MILAAEGCSGQAAERRGERCVPGARALESRVTGFRKGQV